MAFYTIKCNSQICCYSNRDDITMAYFNDVRHFPVLSEEETTHLLEVLNNGSTKEERDKAKTKLIEGNLRFVVSVAKKLGNRETFLDLINEGNMGLIRAIEKYDKTKKCRLLTYAQGWIVSYMLKYKQKQINAVTPPNVLKIYTLIKKVNKTFYNENERKATREEIAEIIKDKYNFVIKNLDDVELGQMISIDSEYGVFDEDEKFEENNIFNSKTCTNNIEEKINDDYTKHKLDILLGKLTDRERYIVEKYYGIGGIEESFDTISIELGVSKERVRQLCKKAVLKLRNYKHLTNE